MQKLPTIFAVLLALGVGAYVTGANAAPKKITKCQEITEPGSYVLDKNLGPTGLLPGGDCLVVNAGNVTIDLDGFVITGDGDGDAKTNNDTGIKHTGLPAPGKQLGILVRNGTVRGFHAGVSFNINTQAGNVIEHMRVIENDFAGLRGGVGGIVAGNVVLRNGTNRRIPGGSGIGFRCPSLITGNVSTENGSGIYAGGPADLSNIGGPLGEARCIFRDNIITSGPSPRNLLLKPHP